MEESDLKLLNLKKSYQCAVTNLLCSIFIMP